MLDHDAVHGIIKLRQSGVRMNLMSSRAWTTMKEKMFHSFGSGAASILFGLGQFYGSEASQSIVKSSHPIGIFKVAEQFGLIMGWGKITSQLLENEITVSVEHCFFCDGLKMGQPSCYELGGIISVVVSKIAGEEIAPRETHCIAKGDSSCKFEIKMTSKLRDGLRRSGRGYDL